MPKIMLHVGKFYYKLVFFKKHVMQLLFTPPLFTRNQNYFNLKTSSKVNNCGVDNIFVAFLPKSQYFASISIHNIYPTKCYACQDIFLIFNFNNL